MATFRRSGMRRDTRDGRVVLQRHRYRRQRVTLRSGAGHRKHAPPTGNEPAAIQTGDDEEQMRSRRGARGPKVNRREKRTRDLEGKMKKLEETNQE